jgi:hypothetical protein
MLGGPHHERIPIKRHNLIGFQISFISFGHAGIAGSLLPPFLGHSSLGGVFLNLALINNQKPLLRQTHKSNLAEFLEQDSDLGRVVPNISDNSK